MVLIFSAATAASKVVLSVIAKLSSAQSCQPLSVLIQQGWADIGFIKLETCYLYQNGVKFGQQFNVIGGTTIILHMQTIQHSSEKVEPPDASMVFSTNKMNILYFAYFSMIANSSLYFMLFNYVGEQLLDSMINTTSCRSAVCHHSKTIVSHFI